MRLINARTLQLETFDNDETRPRYAILSHRWVEKQEVTLQELTSQLSPHKSGWQKIRFCCEEALKHGLEWAWVDTCCIDKSSSAELTEAINSMYRWYQSSQVCFAYLNDASTASKESFCNSLWFTRSWTLQELLAPYDLRFYNASFDFIGDKRKNVDILHSITNIPRDTLLHPDTMYSQPIAHRMSWAAKRSATRVEDVAYSLFGIFEVNLPLLYGEGTRAFHRLQQEIIRHSDDQSIFIWNSSGHGYCPLFASSPGTFSPSLYFYRSSMGSPSVWRQEARPYTLTNVGLHIDCKLVQYTYGIWLAFLPWTNVEAYSSRQYCLFLSPREDHSNVWRRVKLHNRASCTLEEAIHLAYQHSFWPRVTGQDSGKGSKDPKFWEVQQWYPLLERASHARSRAHWRKLYIELNPGPALFESANMLHGIVLDMPSLFGTDDPDVRPFALVSNFDWQAPANPHPDMNPRYTVSGYEDHAASIALERSFRRDGTHPPSRPLPLLSRGIFALYPLQQGPAGALFFEPPRLGLRALVLGFDPDFTLTVILVTHRAHVDVSDLYQWAFPFAGLHDFNREFYGQQPIRSAHWLTSALRHAFEGHSENELPNHVYVERYGWQWDADGSRRTECNWRLYADYPDHSSGARTYMRCWVARYPDFSFGQTGTSSESADDDVKREEDKVKEHTDEHRRKRKHSRLSDHGQ